MPPELFIIRHPETINNQKKIIEDPMGGALSDKGKSQIGPAVKKLTSLNFDKVYSSDSARCKELATTFSKESGIQVEYRQIIREVNSGEWIGMKKSDVKKLIAENKRPKNGEDLEQLMDRAKKILSSMFKEKGRILLITHGCLIKMLIGATKDMTAYEADEKVSVENCEIVKLNLTGLKFKEND
jgi:broad specificity phosphatase PhoE